MQERQPNCNAIAEFGIEVLKKSTARYGGALQLGEKRSKQLR